VNGGRSFQTVGGKVRVRNEKRGVHRIHARKKRGKEGGSGRGRQKEKRGKTRKVQESQRAKEEGPYGQRGGNKGKKELVGKAKLIKRERSENGQRFIGTWPRGSGWKNHQEGGGRRSQVRNLLKGRKKTAC